MTNSFLLVDLYKVCFPARNWVIRLYLNLKRLIFKDWFWCLYIPCASMVKLLSFAQFPGDHLPHLIEFSLLRVLTDMVSTGSPISNFSSLLPLAKHFGIVPSALVVIVCLFGFYGISTFVGYLMPNPFLYKWIFLLQTIQFSISTQLNCQKLFYFKWFGLFKPF